MAQSDQSTMADSGQSSINAQVVNITARSDEQSYTIFDKYKALQNNEIRLLELLPTKPTFQIKKWRDRIECNIIHARLDDPHLQYEALSYCWGNAKPTHSLTIANYENHKFQVTDSLFEAFQLFRLPDRSRFIWADFICINQKHEIEKGEQVARMTDVYQRARQVLGWLGPATKEDEAPFKLANHVVKQQRGERSKTDDEKRTGHLLKPEERDKRSEEQSAKEEREQLFLLMKLSHFFSKPFFSRIWIVQEVAVARKLNLYCGKHEMTWDAFRDLLDKVLEQFGDTLNTEGTDTGLERIFMLLSTRNIVTEHIGELPKQATTQPFFAYQPSRMDKRRTDPNVQAGDLARFISHSRAFGSTDPRDRVFGLRGLVPEPERLMSPQYGPENTADKVFRDFTVRTIAATKTLNILAQGGLHENGLPSWVPDFTRRLPYHPLDIEYYTTSPEPHEPNDAPLSNVLKVSGYKIGTIHELTEGFRNSDNTEFDETKTSNQWQAGTDPPPQTSQIFERTMTNALGIFGPLLNIEKVISKDAALSDYIEMGKSLKTAGTSLYDYLFAQKTARVTSAMEKSWSELSTLTSTRLAVQRPYPETLIGGPTTLSLPPELTVKYLSDLYSIWTKNIESNPWKVRSLPSTTFTVPVELRMLYVTNKGPEDPKAGILDRSGRETKAQPWIGDYFVNAKKFLQKVRSSPATETEDQGKEVTELDRMIREYEKRPLGKQRVDDDTLKPTLARMFNRQVERMSRGRKFGVTDKENGLVWIPELARRGDEVWILVGANVPFVLRPVIVKDQDGRTDGKKSKVFRLVGEAYHHGVMNGEYFTSEYHGNYSRLVEGVVEPAVKEDIDLI